jgi:hypothetical protein
MIINVKKLIKTKFLTTYIKLAILDRVLLFNVYIYSKKCSRLSYKIIRTILNLNFMEEK